MKNILKQILIKLSNNQIIFKIAKKIFIYFPSLKYILIEYAYGNITTIQTTEEKSSYKSDFLTTIKKEIEDKKIRGLSDDSIY